MATESTNAPTYSAFWLYAIDPAYAHLPAAEQEQGKREFLAALEARDGSIYLRGVYTLVGLRANADLMLWVISKDLDAVQRLAVGLRKSGLGRYLRTVETYIGVTTAPRYDPEHMAAFAAGAQPKQFASVYPFVKTSEWYLLSREERGRLMSEHGQIGRKYAVPRAKLFPATAAESVSGGGTATAVKPATAETEEGGGILSNTVDAFGLGDYEFILANESDDPSEINAMMMALRATEVRRYTRLDVPIYLGRLREPAEALADL